jgi:hypothetical protein
MMVEILGYALIAVAALGVGAELVLEFRQRQTRKGKR